ncbi:transcriptional regulator [Xanthomarina sp. F2636L]|uniref:transcriptional regulator n=1 Tax=Xanthomarina sp. F2636L TaxID=2996018 RepID=UPI00225E40DF|nr:transcriptional regulator [Xanthomarina sp. F2636L]MCX7550188.1 transcriptional regulator [Xanthomarina sp. F2636L]
MTSVITGDIIKSRSVNNPELWLQTLKSALTTIEADKSLWEIYRGDSFQIEIKDINKSFEAAIYLKASIKTIKELDVRLAIGIGSKTYSGKQITESQGEAFQHSGETLETLKKEKQNLKIKTSNKQLNKELNLYFRLALLSMDSWTVNSAEIVKLSLENPNAIQEDLGKLLGINQNTISRRQKRANLDEILELNRMYQQKITEEL